MRNQLPKIKDTIKNPEGIRKSEKDDLVHLYFKKFEDTPVTEKYLTAVGKIGTENPFFITSLFTNEIRGGETPPPYKKPE